MAEDPDKKPGKIVKDANKAVLKKQQEIADGTTATEKQLKALNKKTEQANNKDMALLNLARARETIDDLRYQAQLTGDAALLAQTEEYNKKLNDQQRYIKQSSENSEKHVNRLNEIEIISRASSDLLGQANDQRNFVIEEAQRESEKQQKRSDDIARVQGEGFRNLVSEMQINTKSMQVNDDMIEKSLKDLGPIFAGEVDPFFQEATDRLAEIKDLEASGLITQQTANDLRQELLDATTDREKEREAQNAAELQNMALTKLGDSLGRVGDKIGEFGQGAVKTGGLLAGLLGFIVGMVDPEKFTEIMINITNGFSEIVAGFMALLSGDFDTFKTKIGENFKLFGGLVLGLALYFGGPLITAFGGIFKNLARVVKAIKVFRTFMIGLFSPTMLSTLGTMLAGLGATLVPLLPIVAIIGVIVAAFMLIKNYLGEGASLTDTLKFAMLALLDGLSMVVNAFTFIPRKIFGFFGERIGKFLLGDDFKMPDFITKGLKTNRASEFKAEIDTRKPDTSEIDGEIKEQQDLELPEGVEIPENLDGAMILEGDDALDTAKLSVAAGGATVNANQITANTQSSSSSVTNIAYEAPSFSTLQLQQFYAGRA